MVDKVRIFIGCGSGIATSNMAKSKVAALLADRGIPCEITTGNAAEMRSLESRYDLFLVTTNATQQLSKPVIPVFGLLSGINADQAEQAVVEACQAVMAG